MAHYHLVGIGGTGISAIARVLFERGHTVSGSDKLLSPLAQDLIDLGIHVSIGHHEKNIANADVVIRSSAIPDTNPEISAAQAEKIPILKRRDFLTELTRDSIVIAVAGTHGKTTTTAMIAWCLSEIGCDPSFVIGGSSRDLGGNAHAGKGDHFVIEADEYDNMFLGLTPDVLVITNIEHDHPDCFPTHEEYLDAFLKLARRIKKDGYLIVDLHQPGIDQLITSIGQGQKIVKFGLKSDCDYRIRKVNHIPGQGVSFLLDNVPGIKQAFHSLPVLLSIPGSHNAINAVAAIATVNTLGFSVQEAIEILQRFKGTGRRFEIVGEADGITIIDDYAHHPTEILATIAAARNHYQDRNIWTVWQPHTYSRTQQLFSDFTCSFGTSDHVIVTEVFASRENKQDYSSQALVEKMNHPDARFIAELKDVSAFLKKNLAEGDVLLVLSAGDANKICREILNYFTEKEKA